MEKNKKKQIKVVLKQDIAQGHYVNFPIVGYSQAEFILDFIKIIPGLEKADVKSRIIISPMHMKNLLHIFSHKIKEYEKKYGEIKHPKQKTPAQNIKLPDDILPN
jgi:hypothetical protein